MIMKDCGSDMEKVCRSCMRVNTEMRSVFDINDSNGETLKLSDMIMACTTVQIEEDDGLPSHLCSECEIKLNTAYNFKNQCEKSDATFRALSPETLTRVVIKQECLENLDVVIENDDDQSDIQDNLSDLDYGHDNKNKRRISKQEKSELTCSYCLKVLRTKKGLKIHMRRHTGEKLRTCDICPATFTKTDHLMRHMKVHNLEENQKYVCVECGAGFSKIYNLTKHEKEHKIKSQNEIDNKNTEDESEDDENLATIKSQKEERRRNRRAKLEQLKNKKVMECEFCDRKFKYRKSFVHHIQTEHGMSDDSDVPLSTISKYQQEIESPEKVGEENAESKENEEVSNENFQDDTENCDDFLSTSESSKVHTCHVCQSTFDRVNHLTRHMTLHRAVLTHKCHRCEKSFATSEHLAKHVDESHIDKPYDCSVCNRNFIRGEHLIRHLRVHETKVQGPFKCSICENTFDSCDHLARHTKMHLQKDKRHVCSECGKAFNRLDNLKTHKRIHSGIKDTSKLHLCIYCGKEFNNSSNMIVHMRRHTGERPYKCGQCGKGFPRSHDLKCHERIHSGEKPYLCTLCGKSFNKSNKLLRHSRVHTGERPYVCNLCGRAFTQSNDLALHMRRHTGSRPYACGLCPARFIQSGQLKNHRRTTGHWMETQPELKGGHRVEPVTPVTKPTPIKFKTHGKPHNLIEKVEKEEIEIEEQCLMGHTVGIMSNLTIPNSAHLAQPIIIDSSKLLGHLPTLVTLASVVNAHQSIATIENVQKNVEDFEMKCKAEKSQSSTISEETEANEENCEQDKDKMLVASFPSTSVFTSVAETENYNFQNYR